MHVGWLVKLRVTGWLVQLAAVGPVADEAAVVVPPKESAAATVCIARTDMPSIGAAVPLLLFAPRLLLAFAPPPKSSGAKLASR